MENDLMKEMSNDDSHDPLDGDGLLTSHHDELEDEEEEQMTPEERENLATGQYQSMLDTVKEEMGEPISDALANACKRTFGQVFLDAKVKEDLMKSIKIPRGQKSR